MFPVRGRRKGEQGGFCPVDFEIWYSAIAFLVEKYYSFSLVVGKSGLSFGKNSIDPLLENYWPPAGKKTLRQPCSSIFVFLSITSSFELETKHGQRIGGLSHLLASTF